MGGLASKFDPFGDGYDHKTANELIKQMPLTAKRPDSLQYDKDGKPKYYIDNTDGTPSFQAWSWDGPEHGYRKHSGSVDPRTGMVLKGGMHPTFDKFVAAEGERGSSIIMGKDGRLYVVDGNSTAGLAEESLK